MNIALGTLRLPGTAPIFCFLLCLLRFNISLLYLVVSYWHCGNSASAMGLQINKSKQITCKLQTNTTNNKVKSIYKYVYIYQTKGT